MPPVDVPQKAAPAADESARLPIIDISEETPEIGKALVEAAAKWGFLWIVSSRPPDAPNTSKAARYDFDEKTVDDAFELSRKFFIETPLSEKEACSIKHDRGWVNMHVENLDPSSRKRGDFKQAFNLHEASDRKAAWLQPLPPVFKTHEEQLIDFQSRCRNMTNRILRLIALGLEVPDIKWLESRHEHPSEQIVRFLYYPSLPPDTDYNPSADIRAGAHSDYASLTLLFQRPGQTGLEILTPEGSWASVPPFPPTYHSNTFPPILINIGDLLSYWTNNILKSTVHRVILANPSPPLSDDKDASPTTNPPSPNLGADRFSIAVFIGPHSSCELIPMPSPIVAAAAARAASEAATKEHDTDTTVIIGHGGGAVDSSKLRTLTAGEHLANRLKATYGDVFEGFEEKDSGGGGGGGGGGVQETMIREVDSIIITA